MNLTRKGDYVSEGLNFLRQASSGRPRLAATLTAFLQHSQKIEDAAQGLVGIYDVSAATGAQLDGIGDMVGIDRNGLGDEDFRLLIRAQVYANHGDASLNTVVTLAKELFGAKYVFAKSPLSTPASGVEGAFVVLMMTEISLPKRLWPLAQHLLKKAIGGGIVLAQIGQSPSATPFAFAGGALQSRGFGSTKDPSLGAPLASLQPFSQI